MQHGLCSNIFGLFVEDPCSTTLSTWPYPNTLLDVYITLNLLHHEPTRADIKDDMFVCLFVFVFSQKASAFFAYPKSIKIKPF